jgi:hypothetical protein
MISLFLLVTSVFSDNHFESAFKIIPHPDKVYKGGEDA